jgi:glutamate-1-semialdehyde 2,1-aminomutase
MARAYTGRPKIVKFIGFYHGSAEDLMLSNRPSPPTFEGEGFTSLPSTEGLMQSTTRDVLAVHYNDLASLEQCMAMYGDQVAGIIVDPTGNNCGLAQPKPGFLEGVAAIAKKNGALLLFDEVVSGYRYGLGGAQEAFGVYPDLTSFGKVIGGGLPLSAIAGRKGVMSLLDVDASGHMRVSQSGTFFGNPVSMAAGKAMLQHVTSHPEIYDHVNALGDRFRLGTEAIAKRYDVPLLPAGSHSMVQVHYGLTELLDYRDFARRDEAFREQFYLYAALNGLFVPSPTGTFFMSTEHSESDVDRLLDVLEDFTVQYAGK